MAGGFLLQANVIEHAPRILVLRHRGGVLATACVAPCGVPPAAGGAPVPSRAAKRGPNVDGRPRFWVLPGHFFRRVAWFPKDFSLLHIIGWSGRVVRSGGHPGRAGVWHGWPQGPT